MAQIRKRGSSYTISVLAGTDQNGKRIMKHTTFTPTETSPKKIEKEVTAFALDFENRIKNGLYYDGEKMKFRDFVERWKKDYAEINLTTRIQQDYDRIIDKRLMPVLGNMAMNKIRAVHIQSIYTKMAKEGKAPATIRKVHTVASGIFNQAYKWGIIEENICRRTVIPKAPSSSNISCFDSVQASKFLEVISRPIPVQIKGHDRTTKDGSSYHVDDYVENMEVHIQFQVFFNLALFGGFRRGELIALTWNDIDFENNVISITKSASSVKGGQIDNEIFAFF